MCYSHRVREEAINARLLRVRPAVHAPWHRALDTCSQTTASASAAIA